MLKNISHSVHSVLQALVYFSVKYISGHVNNIDYRVTSAHVEWWDILDNKRAVSS